MCGIEIQGGGSRSLCVLHECMVQSAVGVGWWPCMAVGCRCGEVWRGIYPGSGRSHLMIGSECGQSTVRVGVLTRSLCHRSSVGGSFIVMNAGIGIPHHFLNESVDR